MSTHATQAGTEQHFITGVAQFWHLSHCLWGGVYEKSQLRSTVKRDKTKPQLLNR